MKVRKILCVLILCGLNAFTSPVMAQAPSPGNILMAIKVNTDYILEGINNIPKYLEVYLTPLNTMAKSWIAKEDEKNNTTATNQAAFAELNNAIKEQEKTQDATSVTLTQQFLKAGSFNPKKPMLPANANRLSYSILKGKKLDEQIDKDVAPEKMAQEYITYLSASNNMIRQSTPMGNEKPSEYENFYNTVAAIQSFNNHVITGLMTKGDENDPRKYLIDQASSSDWFKKISEEDLGLVLRHILMYDTQIYVELSRLAEMQKQMLAAQAMTNSLLIIQANQTVGEILRNKAVSEAG